MLVAQRLTPAALACAIPAEERGSGRSRLRRARHVWQESDLPHDMLIPRLVRAALVLLSADAVVIVALDTTRVAAWEV